MVSFEKMINCDEVRHTAAHLDVLQVNLGRRCNLACKHCHVQAGPDRTEEMSREVMQACLDLYRHWGFSTIDITGGAPEMNPDFEWFLTQAAAISSHVIVRTNLVVLLEAQYRHLPEVYARNKVEVVCSLPYYESETMDRVRGAGSFDRAIQVIKELNGLGYGTDPDLVLNMVYNPAGAFFPPEQQAMEREYKEKLGGHYGIKFNHLFTIMNNPIGRFGEFLKRTDNYDEYMSKLCGAFNAQTLPQMMCRYQVSVGYDGSLYDCDFNQAVGMKLKNGEDVFAALADPDSQRDISFGNHCYACTAGQGSSCGGATE